MLNSKSILFFFTTLTLLLASAELGVAQYPTTPTPIPSPTIPGIITLQAPPPPICYSGQATILTANCSGPGGLCQGGDPAACNGGRGPNNGAGTPNCSTASPTPTPVDNCPACNNGAGPNPLASPTPGIQATVNLFEIRGGPCVNDPICNNIICGTPACAAILGASGGVLTASGSGTGFVFGKTYISLLYKNPNAKTCSRFPATVFPTLENAANPLSGVDNDFASMMLGFWKVYPDGSATLDVAKEATISGLNNYFTVSVREMQPPNLTCFNCGLDPAPQFNALRACGALTVANANCPALPTPPPTPTP